MGPPTQTATGESAKARGRRHLLHQEIEFDYVVAASPEAILYVLDGRPRTCWTPRVNGYVRHRDEPGFAATDRGA